MRRPEEALPYCPAGLVLVAITLGYLALDRLADAHGSNRASSMVTAIGPPN